MYIAIYISNQWGCDLQKEHERELVKMCDNVPVFLQHFPADIKPFYMRANKDGKTVVIVSVSINDLFKIRMMTETI